MKDLFTAVAIMLATSGCSSVESNSTDVESEIIYSNFVQDSFVVSIKKSKELKATDSSRLVFVADGRINLGKHVLNLFDTATSLHEKNIVVVEVSHIGDWHTKRRRDFIPSDIAQNNSAEFGQASNYLSFLEKELFPQLQRRFPNVTERIFIGHSFSGLLGLYIPLKDSSLFNRYYIISPSCWANEYEIKKLETAFFLDSNHLAGKIKIYAGRLEILNKVLFSASEYYEQIKSHNYPHLYISLDTLPGETHNSIVPPALKKILVDLNN